MFSEGEEEEEGRKWGKVRGEGEKEKSEGKKRVGTCVMLSNTNIFNHSPYSHFYPYKGQITSKVPHTLHSAHRSLTLCPLHTKEQDKGEEEGRRKTGEEEEGGEEMGRRCMGISERG